MDWTLIATQATGAILAIASVWLMGNETLWGPTVSFLSGLPFIALYIRLGAYFVLPMTVTLMLIDVRNFIKWWREGIRWVNSLPVDRLDLDDIITDIEPTDTPFLRSIREDETDGLQ